MEKCLWGKCCGENAFGETDLNNSYRENDPLIYVDEFDMKKDKNAFSFYNDKTANNQSPGSSDTEGKAL